MPDGLAGATMSFAGVPLEGVVERLKEKVPEELRRRSQWVVRKAKIPYNARTGARASSTDSETWSTFDEAVRAFEGQGQGSHSQGSYDGVGFVFSSEDPYAGVDLDKCRDPETGEIDDWAAEIVAALGRYAEKWWQYAEPRPGMRKALNGKVRYIATPRVSKHRVFVWLTPDVLANDGTIVFASSEDYFFGILHSKAHELWARGKGTQLREVESGFRYTPSTTYETFPFPEPTDEQREEIASAARRLDGLRRNWLNPDGAPEAELKKRTLTNLYNARPTWLANAHAALDQAVFAAYGWPEGNGDEEILKNLLALNLERSEEQGLL